MNSLWPVPQIYHLYLLMIRTPTANELLWITDTVKNQWFNARVKIKRMCLLTEDYKTPVKTQYLKNFDQVLKYVLYDLKGWSVCHCQIVYEWCKTAMPYYIDTAVPCFSPMQVTKSIKSGTDEEGKKTNWGKWHSIYAELFFILLRKFPGVDEWLVWKCGVFVL